MKVVELDALVGEHMLDAVDTYTDKFNMYGDHFEAALAIKFCLGGTVYIAIEDPADGYRSMMKEVAVATNTKDRKVTNIFPACKVLAKKKADNYQHNDTLEFIDVVTGKVVLEVGTDNLQDYYPNFVLGFFPKI